MQTEPVFTRKQYWSFPSPPPSAGDHRYLLIRVYSLLMANGQMYSFSVRADRRLYGGVEARGTLWLDVAIQKYEQGAKRSAEVSLSVYACPVPS
jgi:hypothetical protein